MAALSVMPQSFLFSGPRRLGKFSVALEFAKILTNTSADEAYTEGGDILVVGRSEQVLVDESQASSVLSVDDIREAGDTVWSSLMRPNV